MKNQTLSYRNVIVGALLLILGVVMGYRAAEQGTHIPFLSTADGQKAGQLAKVTNAQPPSDLNDVSFDTFWEVWHMLDQDYLKHEKLNSEKMVNGAIGGMVAALDDPYTMYLPPEDNERAAADLAGAFFGVGIELGYIENTLAVVAPLAGNPADKAGIKAGDLILHVKDTSKDLDQDTTGWTLNEAVGHIRGAKDSEVTLTLLRKGDKAVPFEVTLKRGEIIVPSVEVKMVEHQGKRVAHLKLSRFGERTQQEWDQAVTSILAEKSNIKGVILDMRNNPGGFFDGAINIASEFIDNGVVVVQKGRYSTEEYKARGESRLKNLPVEVVVNRGSASASEIVAGALRDRKDAKLIGEKTFGKGTVQDRKPLENGGGVHITIAQWLLPKGDWIHDTGIPVNIEVTDDVATPEDEVLNRAIQEL